MNGLEVRVERGNLVVPKVSEAPLPDPKGELHHLADDFQLAASKPWYCSGNFM